MNPLDAFRALRAFRDRCMLLLHRHVVRRRGDSPVSNPAGRHHAGPRRIDSRALTRRMRLEREARATAAATATVAARIAAAAPLARVKAAGRPAARTRFATALRTASASLAEASHTARAQARKTLQPLRTHPAAGPRHSTRTPGATAEHHGLAAAIRRRWKAEEAKFAHSRANGEHSPFRTTRFREAW